MRILNPLSIGTILHLLSWEGEAGLQWWELILSHSMLSEKLNFYCLYNNQSANASITWEEKGGWKQENDGTCWVFFWGREWFSILHNIKQVRAVLHVLRLSLCLVSEICQIQNQVQKPHPISKGDYRQASREYFNVGLHSERKPSCSAADWPAILLHGCHV